MLLTCNHPIEPIDRIFLYVIRTPTLIYTNSDRYSISLWHIEVIFMTTKIVLLAVVIVQVIRISSKHSGLLI